MLKMQLRTRWQQQTGENGDNGNDDEQFNQGERPVGSVWFHDFSFSFFLHCSLNDKLATCILLTQINKQPGKYRAVCSIIYFTSNSNLHGKKVVHSMNQ